MTAQTGINNISDKWFRPTIDKKTLKKLSKRSDFEGWKHIIIFFNCLLLLGISSVLLLVQFSELANRIYGNWNSRNWLEWNLATIF